MFGFFRKKEKFNNEIFIRICDSLPNKYLFLSNQVKDNIILSVKKEDNGYFKFNLNNNLLDKYEDKKGRYYQIKGILLSDRDIKISICLRVGYGILLGYSTKDNVLLNSLNNDVNVDVSNIKIEFFDEVEKNIMDLFSKEELKYIAPNDVYEIILNGNSYYHLQDIGDGDFIAIDENKDVYIITHDPFEIKIQPDNLLNSLKRQESNRDNAPNVELQL